MRGGTANCTVVVSDDEIGSPLARNPEAVIAMNLPSMDKYEPLVKPGGILVVNQSMVDRKVKRTDIKVVYIEANKIAEELGNKRLANMVMVGGLLSNHPFLKIEDLEKALKEHLPAKHQKLLDVNYQALRRGADHKTA
jgi:2-oxoglutarate ferredoxin oxidoreductase subunit gamma